MPGKPYRLVVLGTNRVGKTALIEHMIFGNHVIGQDGMKTLGDMYEAVIETESPAAETVQIFDTSGDLFVLEPSKSESHYDQEHFLSIADGFVLVYDITSRQSFDLIVTIKHKISMKHRECPVVVVGNKYDLDGIRDVDITVATQWAKTNGVRLYETSVFDRDSLKDPFTYITWCMANPGHPVPQIFQSSPFISSSRRKSFTIPQSIRKFPSGGQQEQPLLVNKSSGPPSPELSLTETNGSKVLEIDGSDPFTGNMPGSHSSTSDQPTLKSTNSTTFSETSIESRISSRLCPDDATYPRGGLLGLADCMSTRSKNKV